QPFRHHLPRAMATGTASTQTKVAVWLPQNENCARTKPSAVASAFAFLINAGKSRIAEGNQYSSVPVKAIQVLATKNAVTRKRQLRSLCRTFGATISNGISNSQSRSSLRIASHFASPQTSRH